MNSFILVSVPLVVFFEYYNLQCFPLIGDESLEHNFQAAVMKIW